MSEPSVKPFQFKQFAVQQANSSMKVGTDAVLLGCWADVGRATAVIDVGTGTGVIALFCAQRNPAARIDAIEIDHGSVCDARLNFEQSPWSDRLHVTEGDYLGFRPARQYDMVISNPPYFSRSLRASDPVRSTARHDDSLPAEKFMRHSVGLMTPDGIVSVIIPRNQVGKWLDAGEAAGLLPHRICHVFTLANKEATRVMVEFSREYDGEPKMESVLIERRPGEFSEAYKQLTGEFYTKW
jgi:tRNA1Val (adenine37-N6)-methyltransferase